MKIVKKENLAKELNGVIESMGVVEGIGKTSGKSYVCFEVRGTNGNKIMFFPGTQDLLRLGIVVDDVENSAK